MIIVSSIFFLILNFVPLGQLHFGRQQAEAIRLNICDQFSYLDFDCEDKVTTQCIPSSWHCDGIIDCASGLDERYCNYLHNCSGSEYLCRSNGDCLDNKKKCDGIMDCDNAEDEQDCEYWGLSVALGHRSIGNHARQNHLSNNNNQMHVPVATKHIWNEGETKTERKEANTEVKGPSAIGIIALLLVLFYAICMTVYAYRLRRIIARDNMTRLDSTKA